MIGMPICAKCKNFIDSEKKFNKCKAFPKLPGIPWKIISGKNNHEEKIAGQTGDYIFEEKK